MQQPAFQHRGPPRNDTVQHHTRPMANLSGIPPDTAARAPRASQNEFPLYQAPAVESEYTASDIEDSDANDADTEECVRQ